MKRYSTIKKGLSAALIVFFLSIPAQAEDFSVTLADSVIVQGGIVRCDITAEPPPDTVTGSFRGRSLPFLRSSSGGFYTLLGIDMETKPGAYWLKLRVYRSGNTGEEARRKLSVIKANFPVEKLTLEPAKVFPDSTALRRIKREDELRDRKWSIWAPTAFWSGPFVPPVTGEMRRFGDRRIINGVQRNPHTGVDIVAPEGAPVLCPSAGKVILTGDFFFTGKSIYIDHGLGLIGMFFHLSRIDVAEGEQVSRGQVIGAVGSTGRASGPHLHWGMRWRGSRVNPVLLLKLELD